ncbi:AAA family ATPase [Pseudomonas sp. W2-17]|uniref:AAA family ATPase n=1 Tax=Pseudomonas sp. W2-17 TaxID=3058039 RepID=UPI0034E0DB42
MIKITANDSFSGFVLKNVLELKPGITVITGRNGSGKTRLLEIIENRSHLRGNDDSPVQAKKFSHEALMPDFGQVNEPANLQARQDQTVQAFLRDPAMYAAPYDGGRRMHASEDIGHQGIYNICQAIIRSTGKPLSDITGDDIRAHWIEPNHKMFGAQDLSRLFNTHIKRKYDMQYAYFESFLNSNDSSLTKEELAGIKVGGVAPWELLNEILDKVLGGKFYFAAPDERLRVFNQPVRLIEKKSGWEMPISQLSSGEKTLMWLALTVFNTQQFKESSRLVPKLLLLDEPDAFLHPQMVVQLYETLNLLVEQFDVYVVIVSHSPTTVALAPGDIYKLEDGEVLSQDKDSAIANLLDGVTQISVDPNNRRQVFVENGTDANVYQLLYSAVANCGSMVDPKISLSFLAAGPKTPEDHLRNSVKQCFGIEEQEQVDRFVEMVNGVGDCGQVGAFVKALHQSKTVRGIVDWDNRNTKRPQGVVVAARDYAYTIDNILLDPVCILYMVRVKAPAKYTLFELCGTELAGTEEWLADDSMMQRSVDKYLHKILGSDSESDADLTYLGGRKLKTDRRYLMMGKELKKLVLRNYPELKSYEENRDLLLGVAIAMVGKGWRHIPAVFAQTLSDLQK